MADHPGSNQSSSPDESPDIKQEIQGDRNQTIGQAINSNVVNAGNNATINFPPIHTDKLDSSSIPNNLPRSGAIAFVGRDDLLEQLDQQLQSNERIGITGVRGMGGIGKTELALQYAIKKLPNYPGGVCWLQSRDQEIATQIVSFARANLGIKPPDELEADEQVRFTWQRWPEGNALIILDDVTDYDAIAPYLPPSDPRFKILITTRLNLGSTVKAIEIEELTDESAIALLKSIVGDERIESQIADAVVLCEWVGNLPLGLELMGRFLARKSDWAIAKLLKSLESKRLAAKALVSSESGMTATLGVAAALELSWAELDEEEKDLARLLGMFAVAPIPWSLVEQCYGESDSDDIEDWRDGLRDRSLIKRIDEGRYQLHQILQEFFRAKLRQLGETTHSIKLAFTNMIISYADRPDYRPKKFLVGSKDLIPHFEETVKFWIDQLNEIDRVTPCRYICSFYRIQGNYVLYEFWLLTCIAELKRSLGETHPDVLAITNDLSMLYTEKGYSKKAEHIGLQVLRSGRQLLGGEGPDAANRLNVLAINYSKQRRYVEAEELYLKALSLQKKWFGEESEYASILDNLAILYYEQQLYEDAEQLHLKAFSLRKKKLGDEHIDIARSLCNLASFYHSQGRYDKAEPLSLKALEMRKKLLSNEHPLVATSLNNLAFIYSSQGRYDKVETFYLEALEIRKKTLGNAHLDVVISLNNLAFLYKSQGRYREAEPLYQEALEMRKKLLGNEHPDVAISLNNLADLYDNQGRHEEAEPLVRKGLALQKKLFGGEHSDVADRMNHLATLCAKQGKYKEAEHLYTESLSLRIRLLGKEHPRVATSLNNLGTLSAHQGSISVAKLLHFKALEIRKKSLGEEHVDVATSYWNLGTLYQQETEYQKAKSFYILALEIYRKQSRKNHHMIKNILNALDAIPEHITPLSLEDLGF